MRAFDLCVAVLAGVLAGTNPHAVPSAEPPPAAVFPALCQAFLEHEGFDASTSTVVLRETRPIFETFALRLLRGEEGLTPAVAMSDDERDASLRTGFLPRPVPLPEAVGPCRWSHPATTDDEALGSSELILALSNVVEDPFGHPGVFARLSLGFQDGGSWYWVSLDRSAGDWKVDEIHLLDISDG